MRIFYLILTGFALQACGSVNTPELSSVPQTTNKVHQAPEVLANELEEDKQRAMQKRDELVGEGAVEEQSETQEAKHEEN